MGRAHGQAQSIVTVRDFDVALSTRRGLQDNAQAVSERRAIRKHRLYEDGLRDHALEGFVRALETEMMRAYPRLTLGGPGGAGLSVLPAGVGIIPKVLVAAYRAGAHQPGAPGYAELMERLQTPASAEAVEELTRMAAHGDPEHTPGLTAPVIGALGEYFAKASRLEPAGARSQQALAGAAASIAVCFADDLDHEQAYYERPAPLGRGLGVLMAFQPLEVSATSEASTPMFIFAARALAKAPVAVVDSNGAIRSDGVLHSWLRPLMQRVGGRRSLAAELDSLAVTLTNRPDAGHPKFVNAFGPLLQLIRAT